MELASRVYDIVTASDNIRHDSIRDIIPKDLLGYWKRTLRMAALCHDLGHLPFSHAAESDLLPEGWSHEHLTLEMIRSEEMAARWIILYIGKRSNANDGQRGDIGAF